MGQTSNRTESRRKDSEAEISRDCTDTMEDMGDSKTKERRGKKKNRNNLRMFLGVLSPENCRPWYFIFLRSTMEIDWHCFKVNSVKILLRLSGSQQTQHEENALQLTPDLENSVVKLEQAGPEFPPPKNEHRCKIQHTISRAYGIFQAYSNSSGMETIKTPHMI